MDEKQEEARLCLARIRNGDNDVSVTRVLADIDNFATSCRNNPDGFVTECLRATNMKQLNKLMDALGNNNMKYTTTTFSRLVFGNDQDVVTTKMSELGYLKEAFYTFCELAMYSQYCNQSGKLELSLFRQEVTRRMLEVERASGEAAARAAAQG